jgi:ectoine hydroxylase-related dioxygenase (phytanoyl-CoA dioxygenase family)
MSTIQLDRQQCFRVQGYFVVPAFLATTERRELRRACDVALDRARADSAENGHTTAKIGLLTELSHFSQHPAELARLTKFISSERVCTLLVGLGLEAEDGTPELKSADYYHEQTSRDWDGDWHRDSQFGQPDPELERERILTTTAVHVRVALVDDDRLEIVPGSHLRWDTSDELQVRKGSSRSSSMAGATRIVLAAGDACVFHAWSIHRATYRRTPVRRTLDALYRFRPALRSPPDVPWSVPNG